MYASAVKRWDAETSKNLAISTVLLVGCTAGFADRVQAVVPEGTVVRLASLANCANQAARWRPVVIALPRDVYAFEAGRVEELASAVGARRVLLQDEDVDDASLAEILGAAVVEMAARRDAGEAST